MTKTKLLSQTIAETYKQVFHHNNKEEDLLRIGFLEQIVEGLAFKDQSMVKLDEALAKAEAKDPDCVEARVYRALTSMREWYLNPEHASKENIISYITEAGMNCVINTLPDCLAVLKTHRIKTLRKAFDKAFEVKDEMRKNKDDREYNLREQAILAAYETLVSSGIEELKDYAITKMAVYEGKYKAPVHND